MIRHDFPDLAWLRTQVDLRFQKQQGWPNVVLNVKSAGCYRPDITGPLSLFMNIKGQSHCGVAGHAVTVPESNYFISNAGQAYTLQIPESTLTETFNLHIGERFLEQVYEGLVLPADQLLNNPFSATCTPIHFFNRLYPKDAGFNQWLEPIYQHAQSAVTDTLLLEEQLSRLLVYLLQVHRGVLKQAEKIPVTKPATRTEIFKRLCYSVDYMQGYYHQQITLEELARVACISKFHYLRVFRVCFGQTPHQYLTHLRLEKAKVLLKFTNHQITDIALAVGLQHVGSLSRLFAGKFSAKATAYRSSGDL